MNLKGNIVEFKIDGKTLYLNKDEYKSQQEFNEFLDMFIGFTPKNAKFYEIKAEIDNLKKDIPELDDELKEITANVPSDNVNNFYYPDLLKKEMDDIYLFLVDKNIKYGSSIMEPLGIFHKGTTIEAINARIDDKLARIKNQSTDEDAELDLLGYLLWKRVLNKQNK